MSQIKDKGQNQVYIENSTPLSAEERLTHAQEKGSSAQKSTEGEDPSQKNLGTGGIEEAECEEKTNIRLPHQLIEKARRLGVDVSTYCENSLREGVKALENLDSSKNSNVKIQNSKPRSQKGSSNRSREFTRLKKTKEEIIEDFRDLCQVDLNLADSTIRRHLVVIRDFLEYFDDLTSLSKEKIRRYLKERKKEEAKATYANRVKALRRLFRDFLKTPSLIEGFKLPQIKNNNDVRILDKKDLQKYYKYINSIKYEATLLFKASSGLRTSEVTGLTVDDVDFEKRMVIPNHDSSTKRSYVTFYNSEAEKKLKELMPKRNKGDERLFQTTDRTVQKSFRRTSDRAGIKVTPKMLRKWFAKEMRNLNVSGEHIDAFCGRIPDSVRGKNYTDFSKERLEEVYENADIRILD